MEIGISLQDVFNGTITHSVGWRRTGGEEASTAVAGAAAASDNNETSPSAKITAVAGAELLPHTRPESRNTGIQNQQ